MHVPKRHLGTGKAEPADEIESGDLLYMKMIFFGGERTAFTLDFSHRFLTGKSDRKGASGWRFTLYLVSLEPGKPLF